MKTWQMLLLMSAGSSHDPKVPMSNVTLGHFSRISIWMLDLTEVF